MGAYSLVGDLGVFRTGRVLRRAGFELGDTRVHVAKKVLGSARPDEPVSLLLEHRRARRTPSISS